MSEMGFTDLVLRRTLAVESVGSGVARRQLVRELERARRTLASRIAAMEGTAFTRSRYRRIHGELSGVLAELGKRYERVLMRAGQEVIQEEYDRFQREILSETGRKVAKLPYRLPVEEAASMLSQPIGGQFLGDWIDSHLGRLRGGIRRELTQSLILGETNREAAKRLEAAFRLTRRGAEMIARTSLVAASNSARDAAWKKNADVIDRYRVVATLDQRTCFVCADYDGAEARVRGDLPTFPLHPNCRCQVVPVTDLEERGEQKRAAVFEQEAHTVHHTQADESGKRLPDGTTSTKWKITRAGQVSGRTTFRDFFERQPAGWQREYLGPARYKLYKAGKLDLADLSRNHRVLTLAQLRRAG